jgi:hypothetical protein
MNNYEIVFPVSLVGKCILIFIVVALLAFTGYSYYKKEMLFVFLCIPICLFFAVGIFYKSEVRISDKNICVVKSYAIPVVKRCFSINNTKVIIREKNGTVDLASATSFHVVLADDNGEIGVTDYSKLKEAELLKNKLDEYIQACLKK